MTEITWPFYVSVFEKPRFRSSTLHYPAGDLEFLETVFRDRKHRFSVDGIVGQTGEKIRDLFPHLSGLVWTKC